VRTPGEGCLGLLEEALPVGGDGLASAQRVLAVDEDGVLGEEAGEGLEVAIGHGPGEGGFGGGDLTLEGGDVDLRRRRRSGGGAGGQKESGEDGQTETGAVTGHHGVLRCQGVQSERSSRITRQSSRPKRRGPTSRNPRRR